MAFPFHKNAIQCCRSGNGTDIAILWLTLIYGESLFKAFFYISVVYVYCNLDFLLVKTPRSLTFASATNVMSSISISNSLSADSIKNAWNSWGFASISFKVNQFMAALDSIYYQFLILSVRGSTLDVRIWRLKCKDCLRTKTVKVNTHMIWDTRSSP